jgi:glycosyltransferase involved in cell wall biosynthesis
VVESDFMDSNRKVVRDKLKIKDNEVVLLLVSRLTEEKNVEFVLRSVKDILRNSRADSPHAERGNESGLSAQGVKLLILGDGYLMPKIKEFVTQEKLEDKIILTGIIERNEIKNYFATGDIFVYGSKSETQGMILTEAMYSGLPIVAVNATGTKSLVLNNGNGYLVKEDKEEFAGAVEKLILDKSLRQRFGEASKKIARENFTSEVCARKMLRMYEKTIGCYSK